MSDASARHYRYIRAWCRMMASNEEYTHRMVEQARQEGAPADAVYLKREGGWRRFTEVSNEETRAFVKQIVDEMEGREQRRRK